MSQSSPAAPLADVPQPRRSAIARRISFVGAVYAAWLGFAGWSAAGIIRHDRTPQAYVDLGASPAYAPVGLVEESIGNRAGFTGSGTLIAPNWVLTAAHVVEDADSVSFNINSTAHAARDWFPHPKWNGDLVRGYDLALVRLAEPITDIEPAKLYGGRREFNATATFVGFGRTGDGRAGDTSFDGVKRAGTNVIDGFVKSGKGGRPIYTSKLARANRTFAVDFDNPSNEADSVLGSAVPIDMEFLIAKGDSGGAVFLDFDDGVGAVLAGIHSFAEIPDGVDDSDYGDVTGHTRVSSFVRWIQKTLRDGGAAPTIARDPPLYRGLPRLLEPSGALAAGTATDVSLVPEPSGLIALLPAGLLLARRRRRAT